MRRKTAKMMYSPEELIIMKANKKDAIPSQKLDLVSFSSLLVDVLF